MSRRRACACALRPPAKHGATFGLKDEQGREGVAAAGNRSLTASLVRSLMSLLGDRH